MAAATELVVRADRPAALLEVLLRAGFHAAAQSDGVITVDGADGDAVAAMAERAGIRLHAVSARRTSLEDAFVAATSDASQYRAQTPSA